MTFEDKAKFKGLDELLSGGSSFSFMDGARWGREETLKEVLKFIKEDTEGSLIGFEANLVSDSIKEHFGVKND